MSTSIDIIPVDKADITFGEVLKESENQINSFLKSIGIDKLVKLSVNLHDNNENYVKSLLSSDKFEWSENEYVWFTIEDIAGGTDGRCNSLAAGDIDPENPWWRLQMLEENNNTISNFNEKLEKAKSLNRLWRFRRSVGQPGIISLSYGLISASIAKLTNGILWSDDAWDNQKFPANSSDFFDWYFRLDSGTMTIDTEWAKECIESIKEELA